MSAPHDILVPISAGELLDKITILEIKSERITNPNQIENILRELERTARGPPRRRRRPGDAGAARRRAQAHQRDAVGCRGRDPRMRCARRFRRKVHRAARAVYRLNDERARLKKAINLASGSRLVEEKSYKSFDREGSEQSR
jgi:hypothetical protein